MLQEVLHAREKELRLEVTPLVACVRRVGDDAKGKGWYDDIVEKEMTSTSWRGRLRQGRCRLRYCRTRPSKEVRH